MVKLFSKYSIHCPLCNKEHIFPCEKYCSCGFLFNNQEVFCELKKKMAISIIDDINTDFSGEKDFAHIILKGDNMMDIVSLYTIAVKKFMERGRFEEALFWINCILMMESNYHQAFFRKGEILGYLNNHTEAINSYTAGLKIILFSEIFDKNKTSLVVWGLISRGCLYLKGYQFEKALVDFSRVRELMSDCGNDIFNGYSFNDINYIVENIRNVIRIGNLVGVDVDALLLFIEKRNLSMFIFSYLRDKINDFSEYQLMLHVDTIVSEFLENGYSMIDVKELLVRVDALECCDDKNTLIQAVQGNHVGVVRKLIECRADIHEGDRNNLTLLMKAAQNGRIEVVKELIKAGVELDARDIKCQTALMKASAHGHVDVVKELIKAGADVNIRAGDGGTALIWASLNNNVEVIQVLIKAGADVNIRAGDGGTALIWASFNGHVEAVRGLIKAGADIDVETEDGETAITYARNFGYIEIVGELSSHNIVINNNLTNSKSILIDRGCSVNKDPDLDIFSNKEKEKIRRDYLLFKNILFENNIEWFYHVTDKANLDSIKMRGLCSWWACEENNINIPMPGGNDLSRCLDRRKGLENYVRLSLSPDQPMIYNALKEKRIIDPVVLLVDPRIVFLNTVKFSNINATDSSAQIGNELSYFNNINFALIRKRWVNEKEKKLFQAEILVENSVPMRFIKEIKNYIYGKSN